ncbi:hypothetical protein [Corynebacterium variabile]|uniref:hypothetical protein n=2 Tax=Corynebacterium variabile TaxID=1727 RepID=UPI003BAF55F4
MSALIAFSPITLKDPAMGYREVFRIAEEQGLNVQLFESLAPFREGASTVQQAVDHFEDYVTLKAGDIVFGHALGGRVAASLFRRKRESERCHLITSSTPFSPTPGLIEKLTAVINAGRKHGAAGFDAAMSAAVQGRGGELLSPSLAGFKTGGDEKYLEGALAATRALCNGNDDQCTEGKLSAVHVYGKASALVTVQDSGSRRAASVEITGGMRALLEQTDLMRRIIVQSRKGNGS